jgi:hypothetical protein
VPQLVEETSRRALQATLRQDFNSHEGDGIVSKAPAAVSS